jgi:hypothetical protein
MRMIQWIEDEAAALVVATISAFFGAIVTFVLVALVGPTLFRGWGAWVLIFPGLPVVLFASAVVFMIVFQKVRCP